MKGFYKLYMALGATASIASLIFLVAIANHIARTLEDNEEEEDDEIEEEEDEIEDEQDEDESGLVDIENGYFPKN